MFSDSRIHSTLKNDDFTFKILSLKLIRDKIVSEQHQLLIVNI